MNKFFKVISLLLLALIALNASAKDSARVVRVKDGDTYVFRKGNTDFTVRLKTLMHLN
jgi:endonuclease YncB( thermonuclease family)